MTLEQLLSFFKLTNNGSDCMIPHDGIKVFVNPSGRGFDSAEIVQISYDEGKLMISGDGDDIVWDTGSRKRFMVALKAGRVVVYKKVVIE